MPVLDLALRALVPDPTRREVVLVAAAIRASGDEEALGLFGVDPESEPVFDSEACGRVKEAAGRAGLNGFDALDLYTEVACPGSLPFPNPPTDEGAT